MNLELLATLRQYDVWAITMPGLDQLVAQAQRGTVDLSAARPPLRATRGDIGVLTIDGPIIPKGGAQMMAWGYAPLDAITQGFRALMADPQIGSIVLNIDSPGGVVSGTPEFASEVLAARGTKPIIAVVNTLCASAAYWIACGADQIIITPSGEAGSIGVFAAHLDISKALETAGVVVTLIQAGRLKTTGNPFTPLDDEARGLIQAGVDEAYAAFVSHVAAGRGVSVATVKADFGEGWIFGAEAAVKAGLVDRVSSLDDVLAKLTGRKAEGRHAEDIRQREIQRDLDILSL